MQQCYSETSDLHLSSRCGAPLIKPDLQLVQLPQTNQLPRSSHLLLKVDFRHVNLLSKASEVLTSHVVLVKSFLKPKLLKTLTVLCEIWPDFEGVCYQILGAACERNRQLLTTGAAVS